MTSNYESDEDHRLSAEELDSKYNPDGDGEHPEFSRFCWRKEVASQNTIVGYWDWVEYQLEQKFFSGLSKEPPP